MKPTRRDVVAGVTALTIAPSCIKGGRRAQDSADSGSGVSEPMPAPLRSTEPDQLWSIDSVLDESIFPSGVQVGDVSADGALVSVWSSVETASVRIAEVRDGRWLEVERDLVLDFSGGVAKLSVDGLVPDSAYCVVAVHEGVCSTVSRFRTALAPDGWRVLTLGATSCLYGNQPWLSMSHVAAERPDLFCLLGDTVYADRAQTVEEYRSYWARALGTAGLKDVSRQTSIVATWDDHEVMNDFEGRNAPSDQVATALQAFREAIPQRRGPNGQSIWRTLSWGATADIFVLDARSERDGEEQYLSREQMNWLKAGLSNSSARFKLILNSVPITDYTEIFGGVLLRDRWGAYPGQRTEILSHIEEDSIEGVLWITGDFHFCSLSRVGRSGDVGEAQWEAMVGPGGSRLNIAAKLLEPRDQFPVIFAEWTSSRITLDPGLGTANIAWIGDDGQVLEESTINL